MKNYLVIMFCILVGLNYSLYSADDTEALEIQQADQQADANDELDQLESNDEPKTTKEVKPADLEAKPVVTEDLKKEKKTHAKQKKIAKHKKKKAELKAKKKAVKKAKKQNHKKKTSKKHSKKK